MMFTTGKGKKNSKLLAAAILATVATSAGTAMAAGETYDWNRLTSGGTQSWIVNTNWIEGANNPALDYPNEATDIVRINGALTASQTINLNGAITIGQLETADTDAGTQSLTIGNGTGGSLTWDNAGNGATVTIGNTNTGTSGVTISATTTLNDNLTLSNQSTASRALTYSGAINAGATGFDITLDAQNTSAANNLNLTGAITGGDLANMVVITKNGAGRADMGNASSTFVGKVVVNAGALRFTNANAGGDAGNVVEVVGGKFGTNLATLGTNIKLNGGSIASEGGNRIFSGNVEVASASNVYVSDLFVANTNRNITLSGQLTGSADLTLVREGTGSGGTVTLTNDTNSFSGNIKIDTGAVLTAQAADTSGSVLGTATIQFVGSGRTLNIRDAGDGTTTPEVLTYGNAIQTLTGSGTSTLSVDRAGASATTKTINLTNTIDIAAGTLLRLQAGNGYRYDLSGTINNYGNLGRNSNHNTFITGNYFGLDPNATVTINNGSAGNLDATVVTNETRFSNGDAYDVGTGQNVIQKLRYEASSNFTVTDGSSVLLKDEVRFTAANGQPWVILRDASTVTFGAGQVLVYEQAGNNRATRIGGDGADNRVIFQGSYNQFLGNSTSAGQVGLVTLETQNPANVSQSGFGFYRSGSVWDMTTNNQTFSGGTIAVIGGVSMDINVAPGISGTFSGATLSIGSGAVVNKTGTGLLDLNDRLGLNGTGNSTLKLSDSNVANFTITKNNVLSGDWSTVSVNRDVNGVKLAAGAIVAHENGASTATVGNLGTAADLNLGLGADFNRNASVGTGTAWGGISTDALANRTWQSGTITLGGGTVTLQGINGKTLTIGGTTSFAGAPAGTDLFVTGNVTLDVAGLDLSAVDDITVQSGTLNLNKPFTNLGGDLILFYGTLNAQGEVDAATVLNDGAVSLRGANTITATKGGTVGTIDFSVTSIGRSNRGSGDIVAASLGADEQVFVSAYGNVALLPTWLVNGDNFVQYDTTTGVTPAVHTAAAIDSVASTAIVDVTGADLLTASKTVRAVRLQTGAALDLGGNTLTVGDAVPLTAGFIAAGSSSITNGSIDAGGREITAKVTGTLDVGAAILNGSNGLTKFGTGALNLNGNLAGLSGQITLQQGTLSLASAPAVGTNFRVGPGTTLGLKADADTAFGAFEIDDVPNTSATVSISPATAGLDATLSFTGTTNVASGNTLNINSASNYNLGVTNLNLAANSTVNVNSGVGENGAALVVSGFYSDTDTTTIQTQRYGSGKLSGLVFTGAGNAIVNANFTTNGDQGAQQLGAVGRNVTFNGSMGHGNAEKVLSAYDGGKVTVSATANIDTYDGNNWRGLNIRGNGMTTTGAGASVVFDAAYATATQGDIGALDVGNLAILETRSSTNTNQPPQAVGFSFRSGAENGMLLNGKWKVTTNDQTYVGNVKADNLGDGNINTSNSTIEAIKNLTLTNTLTVNLGKRFEKQGPAAVIFDATGALANNGEVEMSGGALIFRSGALYGGAPADWTALNAAIAGAAIKSDKLLDGDKVLLALNGSDFTQVAGVAMAASDTAVRLTYQGDANMDGAVNVGDLGALASNWNAVGLDFSDNGSIAQGDFDLDGNVNVGDLGVLASNWNKGAGNPLSFSEALALFPALTGADVPEPASLGLLALGALGLLRRRK